MLIPEVRLDSSVPQPARLLFGIVKYPVSLGVLVGLTQNASGGKKGGNFQVEFIKLAVRGVLNVLQSGHLLPKPV